MSDGSDGDFEHQPWHHPKQAHSAVMMSSQIGDNDVDMRSLIRLRAKPFQSKEDTFNRASFSKVALSVWDFSRLAVSIYPRFVYDARGGGGPGIVIGNQGDRHCVQFNASKLDIPSLDYRSTKVLGLPIPPPLRIDIETQKLQGTVDRVTGMADLEFTAKFLFSIGSLYRAAPLFIDTILTTGISQGDRFQAEGQLLENGKGRLVGVSTVDVTGDAFLDAFLMLPTEALAELAVELNFT